MGGSKCGDSGNSVIAKLQWSTTGQESEAASPATYAATSATTYDRSFHNSEVVTEVTGLRLATARCESDIKTWALSNWQLYVMQARGT